VNFSNFWCTPPALLRIFLELFHLSVERFCNPLNFSPLFPSATTGSIEDAFWGFDFDALRAQWADLFGFLNPEFTDSTPDANAPSMIKCILKARAAATETTDKPVRNVALLPFHPDCPKTYEALTSGHHTQKILITFPPDTFSFWPYQVHLGTRSPFGFTPYKKKLALVVWENEAAVTAFPLAARHQDALANWCATNLKKAEKAPPTFHPALARAAMMFADPQQTSIPLHPAWAALTDEAFGNAPASPHALDSRLLQSASGLITPAMQDIFAATIPNPATAASAASLFTLDTIKLFHDAWTEFKTIHPIPKKTPSL